MMKKIMLFAAACIALVACTKNIDNQTPKGGDATTFEKGQTVTLTVNTGDQTKVSSELVTSGEDKDKVNFAWETGDKIKVTVGTESAEFTLSSGAGTASAEFTGTMPAAGETFDVQYPVTDPDLSSQTYVANGLPKDKMKMAATGCTLGTTFTLTPQYAALRLNLYGLNREVSQIVVTDTTANPNVSYTLACSNAVRVGKSAETATPFLLVVPAGAAWIFKVEVSAGNATANLDPVPSYTEGGYTGDGIVITSGTFTTSSAQTFSAGKILNMPAKSIATVWAPVNCGYVPKTGDSGDALGYPYGKLYQWGRKNGQGYYKAGSGATPTYQDATYPSGEQIADAFTGTNGTENSAYFYKGNSTGSDSAVPYLNDWITNNGSDTFWNLNEGTANPVSKNTSFDPCPEGWRVPTSDELGNLIFSDWNPSTKTGITPRSYTWDSNNKTLTINGLTLFAAGNRGGVSGGAKNRGIYGWYWTSSISTTTRDSFDSFLLASYGPSVTHSVRSSGCSVRCVKE